MGIFEDIFDEITKTTIDTTGIEDTLLLLALFGIGALFIITGLGKRSRFIIGVALLIAGTFLYIGG